MSEARSAAGQFVDWVLVVLTWVPAIGMIALLVADAFVRFMLGTSMDYQIVEQCLTAFGAMLLVSVFPSAVRAVRIWGTGDRRELTSLVVWPGLPIAATLALFGLIALMLKGGSVLSSMATPLAAQSHAAVYMVAAVAALAFGGRDRRLVAVATAPAALLILPYLTAELSISSGIVAQFALLTAVVVICAIAAFVLRRLWPVAAACGAAMFGLVFFPIMIGLLTPSEAFAVAAVIVAIPALIVALVSSGSTGLVAALHCGAREIAAIAAVIACSSVVPMLFNLIGVPLMRADVLAKVPAAPMIVLSCVLFVVLSVFLTPVLTIAMIGALGVVGPLAAPFQGLQAATLAATVALGIAAMALREAYAARRGHDALLPEKPAMALAGALFVIGCGAAVYMQRVAKLF